MKVGEKIGFASFHLAHERVLVGNVTNVSPHGKIFNKHFKKVIVVNSIFQLFDILGTQQFFAQQTPFYTVAKRNFVRRRLAAVAYNGFSQSLSMFHSAQALLCLDVVLNVNVFIFGRRKFLFLGRVLMTKG